LTPSFPNLSIFGVGTGALAWLTWKLPTPKSSASSKITFGLWSAAICEKIGRNLEIFIYFLAAEKWWRIQVEEHFISGLTRCRRVFEGDTVLPTAATFIEIICNSICLNLVSIEPNKK
jgi:hypothetical protein